MQPTKKNDISKKNSSSSIHVLTNNSLSKDQVFKDLTGKNTTVAVTKSAQILKLARESKSQKNYVLAIKRYNTLLVKFPKAKEIPYVYLDKSQMYRELGLVEQSELNLKKYKQLQAVNQIKSKKIK